MPFVEAGFHGHPQAAAIPLGEQGSHMSLVAKRSAAGAFSQSRGAGEAAISPRRPRFSRFLRYFAGRGVSAVPAPAWMLRAGARGRRRVPDRGPRAVRYRTRTVREVVTPRFVVLVPGVTSRR